MSVAASPDFRPMPSGLRPTYYRFMVWRRTLEGAIGVDTNHATHCLFRVRVPMDPGLFRDVARDLVSRHQAFRTLLEPHGDHARMRVIDEDFALPIQVSDVSTLQQATSEAEARLVVGDWLWRHLPVGETPLWRGLCLKLGPSDWVVGYVLHHLVADGHSMGVLSHDFFSAYAKRLLDPGGQVSDGTLGGADFFAATEAWLNGPDGGAALEYWLDHLQGLEAIPLPGGGLEPRAPFFDVREVDFGLDVVKAVRDVARKHNATPFLVLMALQALALRDMFGLTDFPMAGVLANRDARSVFNTIGYLSDRMFYRIKIPVSAALSDVIVHLLEERRRSWPFRHCPSDLIKQRLAAAGQATRAPSVNFTPFNPAKVSVGGADNDAVSSFKPPPPPSRSPPSDEMPYRFEGKEGPDGWRFKFWTSRPDMVEVADRLKHALQQLVA